MSLVMLVARPLTALRTVEENYVPLARDASGIVKSAVFPGLWLDTAAMLKGDLTRVFSVLQDGTASPERTAFVAALKGRKHDGE